MQLVFATRNKNKVNEIRSVLTNDIQLKTLDEISCFEELAETGETLEENAVQKAKYVHDNYRVNCFADDTGLEVEALGGRPGVRSARYAGESANAQDNINLLLTELDGVENRAAKFKTVIALFINGEEFLFEGIIQGSIADLPRGENGFGYDPIFVPAGQQKTFAEMTFEEKNEMSHRTIAISGLAEFFEN
jgi:XTP/dITP diphosphohydrolase